MLRVKVRKEHKLLVLILHKLLNTFVLIKLTFHIYV